MLTRFPTDTTYRLKIGNDGDLLRDVAAMDPLSSFLLLIPGANRGSFVEKLPLPFRSQVVERAPAEWGAIIENEPRQRFDIFEALQFGRPVHTFGDHFQTDCGNAKATRTNNCFAFLPGNRERWLLGM